MVSVFGACLKKEEGAILVYKERGEFTDPEIFARLVKPLCCVGIYP